MGQGNNHSRHRYRHRSRSHACLKNLRCAQADEHRSGPVFPPCRSERKREISALHAILPARRSFKEGGRLSSSSFLSWQAFFFCHSLPQRPCNGCDDTRCGEESRPLLKHARRAKPTRSSAEVRARSCTMLVFRPKTSNSSASGVGNNKGLPED
jgi:hypothetical protein